MKELAYVNLTISPCRSGLPPFTRQSLYASRLKAFGFTSCAEANQPQKTWMLEGAHSFMQVFTICTMNWGMPDDPSGLWKMLMSLFVQTSAAKTSNQLRLEGGWVFR